MTGIVLRIYDYLRHNRKICWSGLTLLTAGMILLLLRLNYKEDISDFLPMDQENATAMSVYQDISGANRIYAIVSIKDTTLRNPDILVEGVDKLVSKIAENDTTGLISSVISQIDMEQMMGIVDTVYNYVPYFLNESDYARMDSLLADPNYIGRVLQEDREMLLFPSSGFITDNISQDPLHLFSPVTDRIRGGGMDISFETHDGYILSPDGKLAVVIMQSAYGAHETAHNSELAKMLNDCVDEVQSEDDQLSVHIIGGPVIAVSNADRIKKDSILAVSIAGILIVLLLIYVFRNFRNILLILVSVAWGWLFAMAGLAIFYDSVSIIVIGIASVILGIAVNYPLHLIDHVRECPDMRVALREIVSPLVVGNVTTVGAFLCLVPLKAPALHDLGLFSSLLLVGTILFVLIFLPQLIRIRRRGDKIVEPKLISKLAKIQPENNKMVVIVVTVLTIIFAYYSMRTEFDTDMRNINYMTSQQREDMDYFTKVLAQAGETEKFYVVSNGKNMDEALSRNLLVEGTIRSLQEEGIVKKRNHISDFLVSKDEYANRVERWNDFVSSHRKLLTEDLEKSLEKTGFNRDAFGRFFETINTEYSAKDFSDFEMLQKSVFAGNISINKDENRYSIVQVLDILPSDADLVKARIKSNKEFEGIVFDVKSLNGSMSNRLSNDFNYIGIACGAIVFLFLWISFGSIELAIISFLPMAISWIWILGIMGMLGIKFNIVNIILATFIFGQGDDYTIFITEGLCYEFAYGKKVLNSYKNSIIVSALIMFIGIGTLIFAQHPAMRSLGEVTVVGMISVVLMAYLIPPLAYKWLTLDKNGSLRKHPITIGWILRNLTGRKSKDVSNDYKSVLYAVMGRYLYKGRDIETNARKQMKIVALEQKELMSYPDQGIIRINDDESFGFRPLVIAMLHPESKVILSYSEDKEDTFYQVEGCIKEFVTNIELVKDTIM